MPKRYILSVIYFARALAVVFLITLPASPAVALIYGAVTGLLWLSSVPPTAGLVAVMFGTRWMAMLFGIAFFSHQVGGFLGIYLGGALFERTGSYDIVWWLGVLVRLRLRRHQPADRREAGGAAGAGRWISTPSCGLVPGIHVLHISGLTTWMAGSSAMTRMGRTLVATFKAIVIEKTDTGPQAGLADFDESNLMAGDVTVRVEWSTVNYKDGLAITGKAPVVRRFPMIPGIDFAGTVEASTDPAWKAGDKVILNGWGCGETHLGAYGEKARVKGSWLVRLPAGMSARDAMAIGTAGYTAMLAVMALERHGLAPGSGPVVVTGAAGGVGSVAVAIL